MEINYVFPHAIATVDMNALVDNKKIHDTIEEHAIGVLKKLVQEFGTVK